MNSIIITIGFLTVLSTLAGGWFAMHLKDKLHLILGFSAGAVIGVAFFDLLPESIELSTRTYDISLVTLFVAIGFTFFLALDRLFSLHFHEENECDRQSHRGRLAATALCFHSFLDGLGIGLAFKVSPSVGWIVAAAVLTHDFSDGVNTVSVILKNKGRRLQAFRWLIADALTPVLGVMVAFLFTISAPALGLLLAIFTGFFIYLGASDLIPESHHHHPTLWTTLMTILGIATLYIIIHLAG